MCASKWAILAVPNGSRSQRVTSNHALSKYLETRQEDLYKYFIETLGIGAKNGDLCLVVSWTKANSWGMAAFSDPNSSPQPCTLKLQTNPETPKIPQYKWDCSEGFVSIKSGPELHEIQSLREEGEDDMEVQERPNQCLFVETLNVTVPRSTWNKILQEVGDLAVTSDSETDEGATHVDSSMRYSTGSSNGGGTTNNKVSSDFDGPTYGRGKLLSASGGRYPGHQFDATDSDPVKAIHRHLLAMVRI